MMTTLAISKPISLLSDDNVPPILPLDHHIINKYGILYILTLNTCTLQSV